jgi:uncharacterized protein (DUF924 family)
MATDGQAAAVLDFWFTELTPDQLFRQDDAVDTAIRTRFGALRDAVLAEDAAGWRDDPARLLAAVILLDQFSRNLFRGQAAAFAADPLALELALIGIARGYDRAMAAERRVFLYMPLMHAEDRGVQRFSVHCFAALGKADNLAFARDHAAVIERFGRYPSRNAALGRATTAEEAAFLAEGGPGW